MSAPYENGEIGAKYIRPVSPSWRWADMDQLIGFGGREKQPEPRGLTVIVNPPQPFKVKTDRKGRSVVVLDKAPPKGTTVTVEVRR